jgi:hypothetical protein
LVIGKRGGGLDWKFRINEGKPKFDIKGDVDKDVFVDVLLRRCCCCYCEDSKILEQRRREGRVNA